jgi:hypothetical protein
MSEKCQCKTRIVLRACSRSRTANMTMKNGTKKHGATPAEIWASSTATAGEISACAKTKGKSTAPTANHDLSSERPTCGTAHGLPRACHHPHRSLPMKSTKTKRPLARVDDYLPGLLVGARVVMGGSGGVILETGHAYGPGGGHDQALIHFDPSWHPGDPEAEHPIKRQGSWNAESSWHYLSTLDLTSEIL